MVDEQSDPQNPENITPEGLTPRESESPQNKYRADSEYTAEEYKQQAPLVREGQADEFQTGYDTRKLFLGVSRHTQALIASVLIFFGICSFGTYHFLTTYKAVAVVLFQADQPLTLPGGTTLQTLSLPTVLDLIKLPANFEAVKKILGLDISVKDLEAMTSVPLPVNNSNMLKIEVKGENQNLIIDIANTLARVAVKNSQEYNHKNLQAALEGYKHQLDVVNQHLNAQLKEIEEFKAENHYFEMTADHSQFLTFLNDVRQKLQQASLSYNSMLVEYENLKSQIASMPDDIRISQNVFRDGQINPLQARIVTLQSSLAEAKAKYAAANPKLKMMESELNGLIAQANEPLSATTPQGDFYERNTAKEKLGLELILMESKVRAMLKVKEDLANILAQLEKEEVSLPAKQIAFARMLDAKNVTESQIKFLSDAIQDTQLMLNVPKGSIALYQLSEKATPLRDSLVIIMLPLFGLVIGIGFGILWALFLEMRDDKLRTVRQVELSYNTPCLGLIPEIRGLNKTNSEAKTLFYIRTLAERLERMFPAKKSAKFPGCVSLALTSSILGEGKSTIAYHLALYFHRLGKKALLLEGDYHSSIFSESNPATPLEAYLKDGADPAGLVIKGKVDRIKMTKHDPWMKELIKSPRMESLWKQLNGRYDLIILDTPGVIEDDYAINLISLADLNLYVINSTDVGKNVADQGLTQLDLYDARPSGIVLNDVLPGYIDDERILLETKRMRKGFFQSLMFWKEQ